MKNLPRSIKCSLYSLICLLLNPFVCKASVSNLHEIGSFSYVNKRSLVYSSHCTEQETTNPLLEAVAKRDISSVRSLLDNGADIHATYKGLSVLHLAAETEAYSGHMPGDGRFLALLELLLNRGADIDARDTEGKNVLMDVMYVLVDDRDLPLLQTLLDKGRT